MRTALVTGGAQGLGAIIVSSLVQAGYRVAIADINPDVAQHLVKEHGEEKVAVFGLDVSNENSVEQVLDQVEERFGLPWLLVNNAAVMKAQPVLEIDMPTFERIISVNLCGTFLCSQRFARRLVAAKQSGRIVNIGSLAGQNGGSATGAHYAASKGGIHTLTKVFARDLAPLGITVNAIAPGPLDLPSVAATIGADRLPALKAALPTGKLGRPITVARMVVEMAREDADGLTGSTIDINSGLYLR
ncbi:3-oxoacyl-ACP reductase [Acetobacter pasteurianus]|uniref:Oxidoreductase n=4 Tax=Acetobacter TaxID=434 RepID=C7JED4_ACEP3|nr:MULTISPECIES: SDR family oxidoreductase [Acetobacter]AOW46938.1 3-oxoacyl-ACP reductase [Acetobacter ascendens]ASC06142.1 3-oxoacyl-[acyl-carrier-protein] reductase [Acetobacter pasteurianus subsp. pasteurianus]BAI00318.1 oxidoreductase [Acetobacter pasteurianus IFO 3283-01]BAI03369.1 oxidoreductase [Acetobacter pasteurianus IFO 3283-03]BAI06414.1 oxidoreductase [Acetobacter pasteurianus IFO 3283-07]